MKIAVFGKTINPDKRVNILEFFNRLNYYKHDLYIYENFGKLLKTDLKIDPGPYFSFFDYTGLPSDISFLFSLGGDGTFLETVNLVRDSGIPVIGVNTGRLGFLASISLDNLIESIDTLFAGKYSVEERTMIRLKITGEGFFDKYYIALNEISVHKKDMGMLSIHVKLNNEYLNTYWSDGLIIATPTGSTAYSMSVGGPIILPETNNFIISPVSAHNLSIRPIVIPDTKIVNLKVDSRSDEFLVSMDSRSFCVSNNHTLSVDKAPYKMNLVRIQGSCFYGTLRTKLMWGIDKRN